MTTGRSVRPYAVGPDTRLAGRYRIERLLSNTGEAVMWRAVDETLARRVAVHTMPATDPRAQDIVAAARAAAGVPDVRFLRVLDAATENGVVYVVQEWVQAQNLTELLAQGPLDPREAAQLTADVAAAMAAAHHGGLTHGCLRPSDVLRTESGQVKVVGLAVAAAVRGCPQGQAAVDADTRAVAAVLYAGLTGRWPEGHPDGLPAAPRDEAGHLCSPRQVRAGVPAVLDDLADRVLGDHPRHAASRPADPKAIAAALAPVVRNSRREPLPPLPRASAGPGTDPLPPAPPPAPSARLARSGVAAVLLVGLGLLGWQIGVDVAGKPDAAAGPAGAQSPSAAPSGGPARPLPILAAGDFDPEGNGEESPGTAALAVDDDAESAWRTVTYKRRADLGGLKSGVGLVVDLGRTQTVDNVVVQLVGDGTDLELRAAPADAAEAPDSAEDFEVVASADAAGASASLSVDQPVQTRFLLVWLTRLPPSGGDFRGGIADVSVRG